VLSALFERSRSGRGQVLDVAIVDGTCSLSQMIWAFRAMGEWMDEPASNLLDSGAPFYDTYVCADGRFVAVGALESQFYALLLEGLGLDPATLPDQMDTSAWPELRERFGAIFATRSRDEWGAVFDGVDACVTPVLTFEEAGHNGHLSARGTLQRIRGVQQAAPAPRFSRTVTDVPGAPPVTASEVGLILADWTASQPLQSPGPVATAETSGSLRRDGWSRRSASGSR
jgi:alpha-methylacyl-CoA racemase